MGKKERMKKQIDFILTLSKALVFKTPVCTTVPQISPSDTIQVNRVCLKQNPVCNSVT